MPRFIRVHICCGVQTSVFAEFGTHGRAGEGWRVQSFTIFSSDRKEGHQKNRTQTHWKEQRSMGGDHTRRPRGSGSTVLRI